MSDQKQGKSKPAKAGDQSMKIQHKGSKHYQGEDCCKPGMFDQLSGKEGALQMSPKMPSKPSSKGTPGDAMGAAKSKSMPDAKEDKLMPMKSRPARNSRNK